MPASVRMRIPLSAPPMRPNIHAGKIDAHKSRIEPATILLRSHRPTHCTIESKVLWWWKSERACTPYRDCGSHAYIRAKIDAREYHARECAYVYPLAFRTSARTLE